MCLSAYYNVPTFRTEADSSSTTSDLEDSIQSPEQIDAYYYSINSSFSPQDMTLNDPYLVDYDASIDGEPEPLVYPSPASSSLSAPALPGETMILGLSTSAHYPASSDAESSNSSDEYSYNATSDPFVDNDSRLIYSLPSSSSRATPSTAMHATASPSEEYLPFPADDAEWSMYVVDEIKGDGGDGDGHYQQYRGGKKATSKKPSRKPKTKPYEGRPKQKKTGSTKSAPVRAGPDGLYLGVVSTVTEYMKALHPPASNGRAKRRYRVTDVNQCLLCGKIFATPRRHLETAPAHGGMWMEKLLNDPQALSGKLLAIIVHFMLASCERLASDPVSNFNMLKWTPARTAARDLFLRSFEDLSAPHVSLFRLEGQYLPLLELGQHWSRHYVGSRTCQCGKVFSRADCVHRCTHNKDSK